MWHDLYGDDDYIHPVHGLEYVLKGSEILDGCNSEEDSDYGKSQQWRSGRLHESTQTEESEKQIVEVQGSPPLVDSSPETLESLMKADKKVMVLETNNTDTNEEVLQSGRLKASSVLIQLITCGTFSFRTSVTTTTTTTPKQHKGEESSEVENNGVEDGSRNAGDGV